MQYLFNKVAEAHDGKGRVVFICQDANGFFVYKPTTGLRTKHWPTVDDVAIIAAFNRQAACSHNNGFFEPGEAPANDEIYPLPVVLKKKAANAPAAPVKKVAAKKK